MNARTATGAEKWYDATTDENGNYELYMPNGEYEIVGVWVASESKWYPLEVSVTVQNGAAVTPEVLNLDLTEKGPNVTGSILKNGDPVAGALMNARTATGAEKWYDATTDEDGNYKLYLPGGEYEISRSMGSIRIEMVSIRSIRYGPKWRSGNIKSGSNGKRTQCKRFCFERWKASCQCINECPILRKVQKNGMMQRQMRMGTISFICRMETMK